MQEDDMCNFADNNLLYSIEDNSKEVKTIFKEELCSFMRIT